MKKVIMILMLLVAGSAIAQRGEKANRDYMKDLSPEQRATLMLKKATLALDLTENQQSQLKPIFVENAKMRKAKMEKRKAQMKDGEPKKLTSEERYAMANERLDHQIAQKAQLKNILNEDQLQKWEKMKHRRGKHKRGQKHKRGK